MEQNTPAFDAPNLNQCPIRMKNARARANLKQISTQHPVSNIERTGTIGAPSALGEFPGICIRSKALSGALACNAGGVDHTNQRRSGEEEKLGGIVIL